MKNELDVVRDVSSRLQELGIPFMLTGSLAMNYYAQPRMTRDIDVVIELASRDVQRMVQRFSPDYYVAQSSVQRAIDHESMFNMIHQESVIKIDCIVRKRADYRRHEFERRAEITLSDFRTYIVRKEDLILSKLVWAKDSHSELQLGDVGNLLMTDYDREYLDFWAIKLGVAELLKECRDE